MNNMKKKIITLRYYAAALLIGFSLLTGPSLEAAVPASERAVLITLYNATGGDNWSQNDGWKDGDLESDGFGPIGSENTWAGITVSNNHVTDITLDKNNLVGSIPSELANLSHLEWLTFYSNNLTGTIPQELGNLKSLRLLELTSNKLSGSIPPELGSISTLYYLLLSNNQLTGSIPPELGNLANMDWLHLSSNQLTGEIPSELENMVNITELEIHSNRLTGNIPPELGNLTKLLYLSLASNQLTGSIPPELGNLSQLQTLFLDDNRLSGTIPAELGNLSHLTSLYLASNLLTGEIPTQLGNLSNLVNGNSGFQYNGLYTDNESLRNFLNSKQEEGNWESTQTIAPKGLSAGGINAQTIRVAWTPIDYTADSGGYEVHYSTVSGGPYTNAGITDDKLKAYFDVTGLISGATYYFVIKTRTLAHNFNDNSIVSDNSIETSAVVADSVLSINRSVLDFAYVIGKGVPGPQTLSIVCSSSMADWSIDSDTSWLNVSTASGTGSTVVNVSVNPSGLAVGSYQGILIVNAPGSLNSPQALTVRLTVYRSESTSEPFGSFATPLNNSTVSSSVPVTGWALDDTGIDNVKIYREEGNSLVYIGDAVFVEGARPDVEAAYPGYPMNYRAGWGYMMLTNFLPNGGNGVFTIHAVAEDTEGNRVTLGTKTITCDNAHAVKPFGAIDTPEQGGTVSGSSSRNHGWVLTPPPNEIPKDGTTIDVYIDGVYLGHPVYNVYRSDIADLFPGYANSDAAHAYFDFDSTLYLSGVHSIFWIAEDNAGNADGIGSRYFIVQNNAGADSAATGYSTILSSENSSNLPMENLGPVSVKRGYNRETAVESVYPGNDGSISLEIRELDRLEIRLSEGIKSSFVFSGYSVIGERVGALPVGSTLEPSGMFFWMAGPGYSGEYAFVFIGRNRKGETIHRDIKVIVCPKFE
jgi:hypothetical protein